MESQEKTDENVMNNEEIDDSDQDLPVIEPEITSEVLSIVNDYLDSSGIWDFSKTIPNFSYLGDVIEAIIHYYFPPPPRPAFPPGPHYFPIKLCIIGPLFSGKHTYAKVLESKYGLKFFEIEKILEERNKVIERKQELEEGKKPKKVQEDESEIFVEEALKSTGDSSKEKARLLRAKIRGLFGDEPKMEEENKKVTKKEEVKCQGWGVLGYPKTVEEAEDLEFELSGFVDERLLPASTASLKKKDAHIIAAPSGLSVRKPPLHKSVFDLVFNLEVPGSVLVKRAVDRRIDTSGNVYNLSYNPPPDNLLPKLKPIEHPNEDEILKNFEDFKLEINPLKKWFNKFGVNHLNSFNKISEFKFDSAKEFIERKIQEWLKIREENSLSSVSNGITVEFREKICETTKKDLRFLYSQWIDLKVSYLQDLCFSLKNIENISENLNFSLNSAYTKFAEFICRDDNKQSVIDSVLEKISKILDSRVIITNRLRKNLFDELDNLSDQLWDIIEYRKEENLEFFEQLKQEDPTIVLGNLISECASGIICSEIKKLLRSINLIGGFHSRLLKDLHEVEIPINEIDLSNSELNGEKLIRHMIRKAKEYNDVIPDMPGKDEAVKIFDLRLEQIEEWCLKTIQIINSESIKAFNTMDRWIGDALKAENNFVNEIINIWKDCIKDRILSDTRNIKHNSFIAEFLVRN